MTTSLAPFLVFFAGGILVAITRGVPRSIILLAIPFVGAFNLYMMGEGLYYQIPLLNYELTLVRVDRLSTLFGYLFHLATLIGVIYSLHVKDRVQDVSGILYAGSALGAVFAGDLLTLFIFWELLALTSVFLILARRTKRSYSAAMRYLIVQVLSGVILLAGVLVHAHQTGSIAFNFIGLDGLASWLIFLAFGIKCGFPFLHNWLTDAYPEATPTGTVFLSAFTTKVAVYSLARAFPGTDLLIYIGAAMTMFPIFFAVIENDLRRVLAYSLINQIGFMVVGIGLGTALAINGAIAHAFNDVIFKGLLFMTMGAVLFRTGKINGSELGGLYRSMPYTTGFCIVGAASISAFPLFSGFVSKSMVMVAALEEQQPVVWMALLFASAGVFHHAGIKIPFFTFFSHDSGIRTQEAPRNMLIAMGLAAVLCIFNGAYPWYLYSMLPFPVEYAPYTWAHILTQSQLLFFSALAFCWLKLSGLYPPELPGINIDAEWSYRKALPAIVRWVHSVGGAIRLGALQRLQRRLEHFLGHIYRHHGPQGILARTWPTGSMAFWTTLLLCAYLIAYYL
jgi:multicomponent Na+:H+ antiporter subunit D